MVAVIALVKNITAPQTQAYIVWPENSGWVERVKGQMDRLQKNAQDLPANVEMELKRLWKDVKPQNKAELV